MEPCGIIGIGTVIGEVDVSGTASRVHNEDGARIIMATVGDGGYLQNFEAHIDAVFVDPGGTLVNTDNATITAAILDGGTVNNHSTIDTTVLYSGTVFNHGGGTIKDAHVIGGILYNGDRGGEGGDGGIRYPVNDGSNGGAGTITSVFVGGIVDGVAVGGTLNNGYGGTGGNGGGWDNDGGWLNGGNGGTGTGNIGEANVQNNGTLHNGLGGHGGDGGKGGDAFRVGGGEWIVLPGGVGGAGGTGGSSTGNIGEANVRDGILYNGIGGNGGQGGAGGDYRDYGRFPLWTESREEYGGTGGSGSAGGNGTGSITTANVHAHGTLINGLGGTGGNGGNGGDHYHEGQIPDWWFGHEFGYGGGGGDGGNGGAGTGSISEANVYTYGTLHNGVGGDRGGVGHSGYIDGGGLDIAGGYGGFYGFGGIGRGEIEVANILGGTLYNGDGSRGIGTITTATIGGVVDGVTVGGALYNSHTGTVGDLTMNGGFVANGGQIDQLTYFDGTYNKTLDGNTGTIGRLTVAGDLHASNDWGIVNNLVFHENGNGYVTIAAFANDGMPNFGFQVQETVDLTYGRVSFDLSDLGTLGDNGDFFFDLFDGQFSFATLFGGAEVEGALVGFQVVLGDSFGWVDEAIEFFTRDMLADDWMFTGTALVMGNFYDTNAAIPEPATLAIVGLGLVGLGLARRRKR